MLPDHLIAPMRLDDVPGCLAVIADAWDPHVAELARGDLMQMFTPSSSPFYYVWRASDQVAALAGYIPTWTNHGIYTLIYVSTLKSHRGKGIATALVERCLADIDAMGCNVLIATNVPSFYTRHGFEVLDDDLVCAGKSNVLMRRRVAA